MSDTIIVQTDREKVRERPGMYIGDNDKFGLSTIVREVIDNAVDEYAKYTDKTKPIDVILHSDNSVTVRDYGRGISPYESEKNPGQIEERLAYTRIGAGGKFTSIRGQNGSVYSGGMNGTGSSATNFMSSFFDVTIWTNGRIYHDRFENGGQPVIELVKGKLPSKPQHGTLQTGTQITFKADSTAMRVVTVDAGNLETYFQHQAYLHAKMKIRFKNERDGDEDFTEYYSENGLLDYMKALTIEDDEPVPLMFEPFVVSGKATAEVIGQPVMMAANIAVAFSKNESSDVEAFTNGTYNNDGGTHVTGFYMGLLRLIRHYYGEFKSDIDSKYKKQIDLIKKVNHTDNVMSLLKTRDLRKKTYVILDFKHNKPIMPQIKNVLTSPEAKSAVDKMFYDNALRYLDRHVAAIQDIIGYLIKGLFEKAKDDDANVKLDKKDAKLAVSTKLAAARRVGAGKGAELILVEGDSAAGTLKANRDANFQAILPLRGKVLNVQKTTLSKALSNNEISTIFAVLGAGFGKKYNDNILKYDKVIICTDADTDGSHIAVLLQTLFMKYLPGLILNGHVYRLKTPLFVNTMKAKRGQKPVDRYTYDDTEQEMFLKKYHNQIAEINRNKGLGELTKEQVIETILEPQSRRLSKIVVSDEDAANDVIDDLMGINMQGRKRLFVEGE